MKLFILYGTTHQIARSRIAEPFSISLAMDMQADAALEYGLRSQLQAMVGERWAPVCPLLSPRLALSRLLLRTE